MNETQKQIISLYEKWMRIGRDHHIAARGYLMSYAYTVGGRERGNLTARIRFHQIESDGAYSTARIYREMI